MKLYLMDLTSSPFVDQSADNLPGRKIEKAIVDHAFDCQEIFDYLQHKHIQPVIKIRSNASTRLEDRLPELRRLKNCRILATNLGNKNMVMAGDEPSKPYCLQ